MAAKPNNYDESEARTVVTVRMRPQIRRTLEDLAKAEDRTLSRTVELACREYLKHIKIITAT
jgi:predicted transcriptional regulator